MPVNKESDKNLGSVPNPGTEEAVESGCRCPISDNHYGEGVMIDGKIEYWINGDCPLHGFEGLDKAKKF